jgi:hypothetical protein
MVMEVEAAAIQKHMVMVLHAMEWWWWSIGLDRWIRSASMGSYLLVVRHMQMQAPSCPSS